MSMRLVSGPQGLSNASFSPRVVAYEGGDQNQVERNYDTIVIEESGVIVLPEEPAISEQHIVLVKQGKTVDITSANFPFNILGLPFVATFVGAVDQPGIWLNFDGERWDVS